MAEWPGDSRGAGARSGPEAGGWPETAGRDEPAGRAEPGAERHAASTVMPGVEQAADAAARPRAELEPWPEPRPDSALFPGPGAAQDAADQPGGRAGLLAGLVCAVVMVLVGPLLGLLWSVSAPRLDVQAVLAGAMSVFSVQGTIDAYFAMICAVAGIVGGLVAYWRAADAGWPVPVGLTAGGLAGALLAGWVGHLRRSGQVLDALPPNATPLLHDLVDFEVRATGLYLVLPGVALLVLSVSLWAGGTAAPGWPRRRR